MKAVMFLFVAMFMSWSFYHGQNIYKKTTHAWNLTAMFCENENIPFLQ